MAKVGQIRWPNSEAHYPRPQLDGHTLPRKIVEATAVATVPGLRDLAADRTGGLLLNMDPQDKSIHILVNLVQDQNVRVREK